MNLCLLMSLQREHALAPQKKCVGLIDVRGSLGENNYTK